jgi:photosystem II stability/assembly factor-like uncharacterized protein
MGIWERLHEARGGSVFGLAVVPGSGAVLAATPAGVFRSAASGERWQALGRRSRVPFAETVVAADDGILIAGAGDGLYGSANRGQAWRRLLLGRILSVAAHRGPDGNALVFAGSEEDGVLRSEDGGASWTGANAGLADLTVVALALSPRFDADHLAFAGTLSGLFRSRNGGRAWRAIELDVAAEASVTCLAVAADGTVWAGTDGQGLFRSDDGGTHWSRIDALGDESIMALAVSNDGQSIAVALEHYLTVSSDGGHGWQRTANAPEPVLSLLFAQPDNGDLALLAGLPTGLVRSTDAGQSWLPSDAGLSAQLVLAVVASPTWATDRFLFAVRPTEGIQRSTDGGTTWTASAPPASVLGLAVSPSFDADRTLLAASTAGVLRSADAGLTWSVVAADDTAVSGVSALPTRAVKPWGAVAVLASGQILRSEDRGNSWIARSTPFGGSEVLAFAVSPDQTMLVAVRQAPSVVLWLSTDHGNSWRRWLVEASTDGPALAVAAEDAVFVGLGAHLLRVAPNAWETRGGERRPVWRRTSLDDDVRITAVVASPGYRRDRTIYLASNAGIFVSRDGGEHVEPWGLDDQPVVALTYADGDALLAVTLGGSIWRLVLGG